MKNEGRKEGMKEGRKTILQMVCHTERRRDRYQRKRECRKRKKMKV
jgi:hypothetical protein